MTISLPICQKILTNEVSKCEKLIGTSFEKLHFPTEDENLKISDLKLYCSETVVEQYIIP